MENSLTAYNFDGQQIRTVTQNGEPWFVAADVCETIGIKNTSDAMKALDPDEIADIALTDISSNGVEQSRQFLIINESGLYTLMLRSRKATTPGTPQHRFRKWVTSEVLPSLRRKGSYTTTKKPDCKEEDIYKEKYHILLEKHLEIYEQMIYKERCMLNNHITKEFNHNREVIALRLIENTNMTNEQIASEAQLESDYIAYLRMRYH